MQHGSSRLACNMEVAGLHEEGWQEEVEGKSTLKWYRLAKEYFGQERCVKEFGSKGKVRLRFRLMTMSVGLLDDKERCGMCKDGKCELCDEGVVEDVVHFLLHCGEFVGDEENYWV